MGLPNILDFLSRQGCTFPIPCNLVLPCASDKGIGAEVVTSEWQF